MAVFPEARNAAARALELDGDLAAGYRVSAFVKNFEWDWEGAERDYLRALELNPSSAYAHYWYSILLELPGRYDEAEQHILRARELDPLALQIQAGTGQHFAAIGDFDRAVAECEAAFELDPDFVPGRWHLARVYRMAGRLDDSLDVLAGLEPTRAWPELVIARARKGNEEEARKWLDEGLALAEKGYEDPAELLRAYAELGERDTAFTWVARSVEARSYNFTMNEETGVVERVGGIKYTIKDGIVYDARELLEDVAAMVAKQKAERGITRLPEVIFPANRR